MLQAQAPQAKSKVCGHPGLGCTADEQFYLIYFLLTKKEQTPSIKKNVSALASVASYILGQKLEGSGGQSFIKTSMVTP